MAVRGNPNFQPWSPEELQILREQYPQLGAAEIARQLERSISAVRMKASELGIRSRTVSVWITEDDAFLKKYYPSKGGTFVAEKLGRTRRSVIARTIKLGIRRTNFKPWQEWEVRYLNRHYGTKTARSLGRTLGRSLNSVLTKAKKLGLNKPPATPWNQEEKNLLIELYPKQKISIAEIAQRLNRPEKGIIKQAKKLKLNRDFFWTREEHQFLAKNFKRMTYKEIGGHLGKTVRSISHYACRHGFHRNPGQRKWSKEEVKYLNEYIGKISPSEIASHLQRSIHSIYTKMRSLKKEISIT